MLESSAQISRDLSSYLWGDIPTREIDQTIHWLSVVRSDCEYKIKRLEQLKKDRQRSKDYKKNLNELAAEFYDEMYADIPLETVVEIIFQRLDVTRKNAQYLAEKVHAWAKDERIKNRRKRMLLLSEAGMKITEIAKKEGLSRQYVSKIVNEGKKNRL